MRINVTRNTVILLAAIAFVASKLRKAKTLGVQVLTEDAFLTMLKKVS